MRHIVTNLTNSPYDLRRADGGVEHLPAHGESAPFEVDPLYLAMYRTIGYYQVREEGQAPLVEDPVRVAGEPVKLVPSDQLPEPATEVPEGEQGADPVGEPASAEPDIAELRAMAEGLGVHVDGRWGVKRLNEEIAKAAGG